ncbi:MAG: hypothetical protein K2I10_06300 [Lachnospiraceae bacterium]|nr:hypothetical protein [Lachnospiraceae bacterium]
MYKTATVFPLEGIKTDSAEINFNESKDSIIQKLGNPCDDYGDQIYYFESELRLDFNQSGGLEFIEFLGGIEGQLHPIIYDVNAFEETADNLMHILEEKNNGKIDDTEDGYSYGFMEISVGIYRESIPENVQQMIEEAEQAGEPLDDEDIEHERKMANHWATIGIGIKDYFKIH